jgi:hypothetical protein
LGGRISGLNAVTIVIFEDLIQEFHAAPVKIPGFGKARVKSKWNGCEECE